MTKARCPHTVDYLKVGRDLLGYVYMIHTLLLSDFIITAHRLNQCPLFSSDISWRSILDYAQIRMTDTSKLCSLKYV